MTVSKNKRMRVQANNKKVFFSKYQLATPQAY